MRLIERCVSEPGRRALDVVPFGAAVLRDKHAAVVGPRPEEAGLERRLGQGGDGVAAVGARAGRTARHVGADRLPAVAAVHRPEDVVAAIVDRL